MNSKLTLVLMAGLPAAGKSTLASKLSYALNWHVIHKDSYIEVLLKEGLDDEKASRAAYELAFETARSVLREQQASVILDSAALYPFILKNALDIVNSVPNAQLKVLLCVADRDLRNERLQNRPSQFTKIRFDPATMAEYFQLFEHLPSDKLTLYTVNPLEACLAAAEDYLQDQGCDNSCSNHNDPRLAGVYI